MADDTRPTFTPLPSHVDLPRLDREVLDRWAERKVFARSLEQTATGPRWVFYEGPPTANGTPGTHHVEARVFKDVFPRFKTMKGFHVPRRAGWDCHGLPVELAVEKELGFTGKPDIERYGIAEFNTRCRESVARHVDEFTAMTERMGYWVDFSQAYWTMSTEYVESVWWSLKRIFEAGLLVADHRVAPYCPRCGTGLSDHEVAQGYETVVDPSVFVRFPVTGWGPAVDLPPGVAGGPVELLVWTTTPWTLVSNTAVAVHPDVSYAVVRTPTGTFVVAEPLLAGLLGDGASAEVLALVPGRTLEGTTYAPPFDLVEIPQAHRVVLAGYVTTADGTGLVHQAPAFGADDLAVCRAYGLPVVNPIEADGTFAATVPLVGGIFFKDADRTLVADLERRGRLFRQAPYEHSYPHCWRCHTPLMYYAQPSWYIRTSAVKDQLLAENERTTWYPAHIKHGRYGDWLNNNVDWALSRNRYWGTPLPLWRCPAGHLTAVGSLAELGTLAGRDTSGLDPHRPYVDEVTLACPECGERSSRVPEVIDAWYDSGSMPFAQVGYPHRPGSAEELEAMYPAQFICEAIDQTRGWFYTLMAVGTLVFERSSYQNVLCLGHILAEDGRKMSKHLGNILEPIPLMDAHGADALRWFMLASGSPWTPRRVGPAALEEIVRKVLLTYWSTASFLTLYGHAAGWRPGDRPAPAVADRPALDRWAISEAHRLARDVDAALEEFDTTRAGRLLGQYVEELSNWYVRRSRRRFWGGDPAALATLYECLRTLTLLMAPFAPFLTDAVWERVFHATAEELPDSVHLARWPDVDAALIDDRLAGQVAMARRLVEAGRAARAASGVRTRQPLSRALVGAAGWGDLPAELRAEIAEELNVGEVSALRSTDGELVDVAVKPNFRALGKRFGSGTKAVAAAVAQSAPAALATAVREGGRATVLVDGTPVELSADELLVTETPRTGWSVATEGGETVALDLTITPELRRAGLAREVVRLVQEARKSAGFDISDRIALWWSATGETGEALAEHGAAIAEEVLASTVTAGGPAELSGLAELVSRDDPELGLSFWLRRA
ncbi:MAG: isoleucine--tRNA ligase [Actinobacteria bacterium]|nr:isoleucine--tRNA ligase [Actinomycetota bacterium]